MQEVFKNFKWNPFIVFMMSNTGIVIFTCLFFWPLNAEAQGGSDDHKNEQISFLKLIGDTGKSRGVAVDVTNDGGYILTGYTTDGEYGGEDVFLIKTDLRGETIWRKTYGGKEGDYGWAVRQNDDGGFIIAGYTTSFGKGGMDVYLIKTDARGDAIWTKTFGGEGDEYGWDVRITGDNSYIVAAETNSIGEGAIDAYLLAIDEDGNEKWSKTYGGKYNDRIFSVQQTQDGGFVAAGITYSFTSVGSGDRDGYLLKVDPSGKQLWYKTFGKDLYDVAHSVAITGDMGYIITGYGESYSENGSRDVYLIKTDDAGETQWIKTHGVIEDER